MGESLKFSFAPLALPKSGALVVLTDAKLALGSLASGLEKKTRGLIRQAAAAAKFRGKRGNALDIVMPRNTRFDQLLVVGAGNIKDMTELDWIKLGGFMAGRLGEMGAQSAALIAEVPGGKLEPRQSAALLLGARLVTYQFNRFKTKKKREGEQGVLKKLTLLTSDAAAVRQSIPSLEAVAEGVDLARTLINLPANILGPVEFAEECQKLRPLGVAVTVLAEKEMKRLGMGALLGVGQGSVRGSRLAVMEWRRGPKNQKPVAIVGKGVVFDSGGLSIKPAEKMEDMKGDMGGAACVIGLLHALAARKAKVNVIGVVGIVENMPDGNAQRPGDIVTSMSGQTVEVINTDAEGRLVLADVLWYTQDKYKPQVMVNLATLTGAILIALGQEYAGLFSNNDQLSERLTAAGQVTGERLWRFPLGPEYDKMIESKFADMKNVAQGRMAGSIVAAQFLQRFVNDTPWAHLDIAGTGIGVEPSDINKSWAAGFGVRLLNQFIAENYEAKT